MKPKITYKQLRHELEKNGWSGEPLELDVVDGYTSKSTIFRNPMSDLFIVLPQMKPNEIVEPIYLLRVRNVLENAGFWDSLQRQTGTANHKEATHVLQTLAGIKFVK